MIDSIPAPDIDQWRRSRPFADPFSTLTYGIIGQQISGYAARAIAGRLQELFDGKMPTAKQVLTLDDAAFRKVGFSGRKTEYIRSLAEHVVSGELDIEHLDKLSDDDVRRQISAIRGLGRWTADMFLLISLNRPDIIAIGDLGIREAIQRLYRLDHLPGQEEVEKISQKWRPHRTLASLYLWAWLRQEGTQARAAAAGARQRAASSRAKPTTKR